MKNIVLVLFTLSVITFTSCSSDDDTTAPIQVTVPDTYVFNRDGNSTVSFGGQTTRINMADELSSALKNTAKTEAELDAMFDHQAGQSNFDDANLNASSKSIRSKTAASADYFSANTTDANAIKSEFNTWIASQVNEVFPNWATTAQVGVAGQLQEAGGGPIRYVSAKGLEFDQAFTKSLIGALMTDQMLNNYLSTSVLDAGDNIANNDNDVLADGKNYTTMEHKWDEAFGYLYGKENNPAVPVLGVDGFLNKYLLRVDNDTDFSGIKEDIFNAFKLGRAAIVAKDYTVRDAQAEIIREKVSLIIAVRAVFYLQNGKNTLGSDYASAFHDLSEGFGFIYSLQFTRKPGTSGPYFTKLEVDAYIAELMVGNGFWDVTSATLDEISDEIATRFGFTSAQAAN